MDYYEFEEFVQKVKEETDIVDVIRDCITLSLSLRAKCPFHDDRNPSFSVNASGQYFYCFGCGVGGDVIKFLQLYEGKCFMEVVRELASRAGLSFLYYSFKG